MSVSECLSESTLALLALILLMLQLLLDTSRFSSFLHLILSYAYVDLLDLVKCISRFQRLEEDLGSSSSQDESGPIEPRIMSNQVFARKCLCVCFMIFICKCAYMCVCICGFVCQ